MLSPVHAGVFMLVCASHISENMVGILNKYGCEQTLIHCYNLTLDESHAINLTMHHGVINTTFSGNKTTRSQQIAERLHMANRAVNKLMKHANHTARQRMENGVYTSRDGKETWDAYMYYAQILRQKLHMINLTLGMKQDAVGMMRDYNSWARNVSEKRVQQCYFFSASGVKMSIHSCYLNDLIPVVDEQEVKFTAYGVQLPECWQVRENEMRNDSSESISLITPQTPGKLSYCEMNYRGKPACTAYTLVDYNRSQGRIIDEIKVTDNNRHMQPTPSFFFNDEIEIGNYR